MDNAKLKKWIDALTDSYKWQKSLETFDSEIKVINNSDIHVYKGIDIMANAVKAKMKENFKENAEFPYHYSFVYKGVEFVQLEKERLHSK